MLISTSPGHQHRDHLVEQLENAVRAELAVAYVQQSGVRTLGPLLARLCKEGEGVRMICSFDMGITDPEAIGALKSLGVDVRVYKADRGSFHPKVWLFGGADEVWYALVGSANFSASAMYNNVEASILSQDDETVQQAKAFFKRLWNDEQRCHSVSDVELKQWAENRQRRQAVARQVMSAIEKHDDSESIQVLEEFVTNWIDIGVHASVQGAGKVVGKEWRGWYIIPDQGLVDDELMGRLIAICRIIAEKADNHLDISKNAPMNAGTALNEILKITSGVLKRPERKMSDRDLFIRREKNYLIKLGLAITPNKTTLSLTQYGLEISDKNTTNTKRIYTDAIANYVYNGLNLLAFTRRLLEQVQQLDFVEFSFFARHAWTLEEVDVVSSMIRMYRRLGETERDNFVAKMDAYFEKELGPTGNGVKMNYDKSARHTMSVLGWCEGLSYSQGKLMAINKE
ncbi:MAG: phospholipase D-like domain-containing protein [Pseudohongiellaceae bacterium]